MTSVTLITVAEKYNFDIHKLFLVMVPTLGPSCMLKVIPLTGSELIFGSSSTVDDVLNCNVNFLLLMLTESSLISDSGLADL